MRKSIKRMRKEQRAIGDAILKDPTMVVYLNASELARTLGVSPSSIVRFAKKLGFKGYPEFRRAIIEHFGLNKTPLEYAETMGELFNRLKESEVKNLRDTLGERFELTIDDAAKKIKESKGVLIAGYGTGGALAELLGLLIVPSGVNTKVVKNSYPDFLASLYFGEEKDVVIVFSFLKHVKELIKALDIAREMKRTVIAVTDSLFNPVSLRADLVIPVKVSRVGFLFTLTPLIAVVTLLAARVAELRESDVKRVLKITKKIWEETDLFFKEDKDA